MSIITLPSANDQIHPSKVLPQPPPAAQPRPIIWLTYLMIPVPPHPKNYEQKITPYHSEEKGPQKKGKAWVASASLLRVLGPNKVDLPK